MNGLVIPLTPIAVDFWRPRAAPQAKIFFLTHMHADHTMGLSSSWSHQIYCSEISARLLQMTFQLPPEIITVLDIGSPTLISVDFSAQQFITVTAMDANHCPGSLMFLFEGYFGKILYTGDFRYDEEFMKQETLQTLKGIDVLYLDNTYCDPRCIFPTRQEACSEIIKLMHDHHDYDVVIGVYSLGKEWLLEQIAVQTSQWIVVEKDYYERLRAAERAAVFSTGRDDSLVRVVKARTLTTQNLEKWNAAYPTIAILPTALYVSQNKQPPKGIHVVAYSDHSSYDELVWFVSQLQPKSVVPIVKGKGATDEMMSRADMSCFAPFLSNEPKTACEIPFSVVDFMSGYDLQSRQERCMKPSHRPNRLQRKRSAPSGVVFSDSPLKKKTIELQQTEERESEKLDSLPIQQVYSQENSKTEESRSTPVKCINVDMDMMDNKHDVKIVKERDKRANNVLSENDDGMNIDGGCRVTVDGKTAATLLMCVDDVCAGEDNSPAHKRFLPSWLDDSSVLNTSDHHTRLHPHSKAKQSTITIYGTFTTRNSKHTLTEDNECSKYGDNNISLAMNTKSHATKANRMEENISTDLLSDEEDQVASKLSTSLNNQSHLKLQSILPDVQYVRHKSCDPAPCHQHTKSQLKQPQREKSLYEQFYVGKSCEFARRLLFPNMK
ncbi:5' exonuclease Apollo-like [Corticium candelabrum]|uniref:5' exonuclease Apollo-like n=1 Tax=Corticium candelabrum TaxID=121492 RepID=UPI002E25F693|nr:5' exonuclease Apollo-like [Corticium candelabrum]